MWLFLVLAKDQFNNSQQTLAPLVLIKDIINDSRPTLAMLMWSQQGYQSMTSVGVLDVSWKSSQICKIKAGAFGVDSIELTFYA